MFRGGRKQIGLLELVDAGLPAGEVEGAGDEVGGVEIRHHEGVNFEACGQSVRNGAGAEVEDDEVAFGTQGAGVDEDGFVFGVEVFVVAVDKGLMGVAEGDEFGGVVVDGVGVGDFGGGVDLGVVGVFGEPGLGCGGEAAIRGGVPLHWRARVVAAGVAEVGDEDVLRDLAGEDVGLVGVLDLDVVEVGDGFEGVVGHAEFVALVEEGRAAQGEDHGREELGGGHAELGRVVAEGGDDAGVVVVGEEDGVPAVGVEHFGVAGVDGLERGKVDGLELRAVAVGADGVEVEDHVELVAVVADDERRLFEGDAEGFADGHDVVLRDDVAVHLLQVFVQVGAVGVGVAVVVELVGGQVGEGRDASR